MFAVNGLLIGNIGIDKPFGFKRFKYSKFTEGIVVAITSLKCKTQVGTPFEV
jgi:hypothetical protein